jgi:hypothetical protein
MAQPRCSARSAAVESGFEGIGNTLTEEWLKRAGADGQAILDTYSR